MPHTLFIKEVGENMSFERINQVFLLKSIEDQLGAPDDELLKQIVQH